MLGKVEARDAGMSEKAVNPAADHGAHDADDDVGDDAARRLARHDPAGDEPDDQTEDDHGTESHMAFHPPRRGTEQGTGAAPRC